MSVEFEMPKIQPVMEHGSLICWRKKVGEHVKEGEILLEVETEKAVVEVESTVCGVVLEILVPAGEDDVAVGTPLAVIGEAGEQVHK